MQRQIIGNHVKMFVRMRSIQGFEKSDKDMATVAIHAAGFHGTLVNGELLRADMSCHDGYRWLCAVSDCPA